ncbi:hypothetical protein GALL_371850 [mine drainage metagenome]|uniref:Uncharacterized protein n=1 Tax=mine drainage metagenome TaxID=410659 RepID=A0A1J5QCW6_9ZZZZ
MIHLHAGASRRRAHTADQHIALRHGIHRAIGTLERRHQEGAATQTLGITHRGHGHIQSLAVLGKWRQRSGHHHRSHVLELQQGAGWQIHTHVLQHADDALHRKWRLRGHVASAVETHHEAVAHQLIAAYALNRRQILDPVGVRRHRREGCQQCDEASDAVSHDSPLRTAAKPRRNATACWRPVRCRRSACSWIRRGHRPVASN